MSLHLFLQWIRLAQQETKYLQRPSLTFIKNVHFASCVCFFSVKIRAWQKVCSVVFIFPLTETRRNKSNQTDGENEINVHSCFHVRILNVYSSGPREDTSTTCEFIRVMREPLPKAFQYPGLFSVPFQALGLHPLARAPWKRDFQRLNQVEWVQTGTIAQRLVSRNILDKRFQLVPSPSFYGKRA